MAIKIKDLKLSDEVLLAAETQSEITSAVADIDLSSKQDTLVSGTNLKTINSTSLLGSGNLVVGGGTFEGTLDDIPDGVTYQKLTLLDIYPVGAIYISVVSTSPATLFGGTWSAFGAGRVLVGIDAGQTEFDTVEETGGAKTVQSSAQTFTGTPFTDVINHTHAVNITDNGHAHTQRYGAATGNFTVHVGDTSGGGTGGSAALSNEQTTTTNTTGITATTNNPAGGVASITPAGTNTPGAATSVLQPYIVVYMWKRTA